MSRAERSHRRAELRRAAVADKAIQTGGGASADVIRLQPGRDGLWPSLTELWARRELLVMFTRRDLQVRYKQAVLGAGWAVLQPILTMVVFSVFFGRVAHVPSDGVPYPLFSLAGLVPWTFFANSVTNSTSSLVQNASMLTKIYFPRLALPLAAILACLVDLAIAIVVLFVVMLGYGYFPDARVLVLPALTLVAVLAAAGMGSLFGALSIEFRDFRYVVPFLVQLGLFATPVVYPASLIPAEWRLVYALNPMVGVVAGYRWALLGGSGAILDMVIVSTLSAVVMLTVGVVMFNRKAGRFADVA